MSMKELGRKGNEQDLPTGSWTQDVEQSWSFALDRLN